jgi:hypothetical protein
MPGKPPSAQDLTIVIPVYNEAKSLPHFVPELQVEYSAEAVTKLDSKSAGIWNFIR